jgi:hypothetical protein
VGTTLAVLLAMSWSFRVVALIAITLYVAGVALLSLQPIGKADALRSGAGGESKDLAAVGERGSAEAAHVRSGDGANRIAVVGTVR